MRVFQSVVREHMIYSRNQGRRHKRREKSSGPRNLEHFWWFAGDCPDRRDLQDFIGWLRRRNCLSSVYQASKYIITNQKSKVIMTSSPETSEPVSIRKWLFSGKAPPTGKISYC